MRILGDPSDLSRALKQSTAETETFGNKFGAGLKAAGLVAGAGIAVAGAAIFESVKAAEAAQQSQARLDQAFKNVGLSAKASAGLIDQAESSSRKLGFTDTETRSALGSLVTATGSVSASMKDLSVAQDLARFKSTSLEAATKTMAQAMTGSQRAAKQLGISVPPVTTAYDALKATFGTTTTASEKLQLAHAKLIDKMATGNAVIQAVSDKVKGQGQAFADTAAGGMAQFNAQFDAVKVQVGNVFLPALTSAATGLATFMGKFADASGFQAKFKVVLDGIVNVAKGAGQQIAEALSSGFNSSAMGAGNRNTSGAADALAKNLQVQLKLSLSKIDWNSIGAQLVSDIGRGVTKGLPALYKLNIQISAALGQAMVGAFNAAANAGESAARKAFTQLGQQIVDSVVKPIGNLDNKVGGELLKVVAVIAKLPRQMANALIPGTGLFFSAGVAMIEGLANGITSMASKAADAAANVAKKAYDSAKHFLGIGSPSKLFHEVGVNIIEGLSNGITDATPKAVSSAVGNIGRIKAGIDTAVNGINDAVRSRIQQVIKTIEGPWGAEIVINGHVTTHITGPGPAVAGPSVLGDIAQINALDAAQQANQQAITDYTNTYVDTSFATPGYNIGMTPAQVYALAGNQTTGVTNTQGASQIASIASNSATVAANAASQAVYQAITGIVHPGMQFATGGVVPGAIGQPIFATVHGGETVVPYGAMWGGGGDTYNFHFPNYAGTKQELVTMVRRELMNISRRNG